MKNKKSGFTLLEIIVVLIIIGVLAAIALPNLFANIERSRANEALANLTAVKTQVEACVMANGGGSAIGCQNIPVPASPWWTFAINTGAAGIVSIRADRAGAGAGDSVWLSRTALSVWNCTGVGSFAGVC